MKFIKGVDPVDGLLFEQGVDHQTAWQKFLLNGLTPRVRITSQLKTKSELARLYSLSAKNSGISESFGNPC